MDEGNKDVAKTIFKGFLIYSPAILLPFFIIPIIYEPVTDAVGGFALFVFMLTGIIPMAIISKLQK